MPPNRIDPTAAPSTEPDPPLHPFTSPLVPARFAPFASAAVALASALLVVFTPGSWPFLACNVVVGVGAAIGIVSRDGVTKKRPE